MADRPTELLNAIRTGDEAARGRLMALIYDHLHGLAQRLLDERPRATIQATELIHEAWLRLDGGDVDYENLRHYRRVAARAMRFVLVDRARARLTKKRGEAQRPVTLDDELVALARDHDRAISVHEGLELMVKADPDLAQLVELRFFGGLTMEEIAENLGISTRSAHRRWRFARAWWLEQFGEPAD